MKLYPKATPYSSVVGGGLSLTDAKGRTRLKVLFIGTTDGVTKEEDAALTRQFIEFIEAHGLEVPDR
jgi:hypothetical protein